METKAHGRFDFIDLLKGLGIFLVVWGHTMTPRSVFIYSFHMPLFFFISGYLHRNKPIQEFFIGKIKRLLIPYALVTVLSWLFYLVVIIIQGNSEQLTIHLPKIASLFTGSARNGGNDPIWFLTCLFVVSALFWLYQNFLKDDKRIAVVIAAGSLIGYLLGAARILLPFKIDAAFSGLVFYFGGYLLRKRSDLTTLDKLGKPIVIITVALCLVAQFILARFNVALTGIPKVSMISNNLGNYFLFYITAVLGIAALLVFGYRVRTIPVYNSLGKHSLSILATHKPILFLLGELFDDILDIASPAYCFLGSIIAILINMSLVGLATLLGRYLPDFFGTKNPSPLSGGVHGL
ncbi:MAG TPA: acyltransferase family protein [Bacillota bacterium]